MSRRDVLPGERADNCYLVLDLVNRTGEEIELTYIYCILSRWDVLPGERADNCFLVLDLVNRTGEEIELTYTVRKQLQIEAGGVCRSDISWIR